MQAADKIFVVNTKRIDKGSATKIIPYGASQLPVSRTIISCEKTRYVTYKEVAKFINIKIFDNTLATITPATNGIIMGSTAKLLMFITSQLFHIICFIFIY